MPPSPLQPLREQPEIAVFVAWTVGGAAMLPLALWMPWMIAGGLLMSLSARPAAWAVEPAPWIVHLSALAVPQMLLLFFYLPTLGNGFSIDDPCHLVYVQDHGLWASFHDRANQISAMNFTPFYPLSFGLDYRWFGLDPTGYYAHHLLSFALLLGAVYLALILYLPPIGATFVLTAMGLATITVYLANTLMVRHYLEGLAWAALALVSYVLAARRGCWRWALAGAVLYLAAALNKELYVPLVGILPFLPEGNWRRRLRAWAPFALAAAGYIAWRGFMQNQEVVAGYSGAPLLSLPLVEYVRILIAKLPLILAWSPWLLAGFVAFIFALLARAVVSRPWTAGGLVVVWSGAILAPIIPVIPMLTDRYVLLLVFGLFAALFIGLYQWSWAWRSRWLVLGGGVALLLTELHATLPVYHADRAAQRALRAESRFMLANHDADTLLITPNTHCFSAYNTLRERAGHAPKPFANSPCTVLTDGDFHFMAFQQDQIQPLAGAAAQCPGLNPTPLTVQLTIEQGQARWAFGPMTEERYQVQFSNGEIFPILRQNQLSVKNLLSILDLQMITQRFRIVYTTPDGQTTLSDWLESDFQSETRIQWQRAALH